MGPACLETKLIRCAAVLVVLVALVGGCSTASLAYLNADWWLVRTADDYLDLTERQRQRLGDALSERLAQHRNEELSGYVDWLDRVGHAAQDGLEGDEVEAVLLELERLYGKTVEKTVPLLARVLTELSTGQLAHLRGRFAAANRDFRAEYLNGGRRERLEARGERIIERIERWTGRMTASQRGRIAAVARQWPDSAPAWYEYRSAKQRGLLRLLEQGSGEGEVSGFLVHWWVDREGWSDFDPAAGGRSRRDDIIHLLMTTDALLTPSQRNVFVSRVHGYRDDLAGLLPPAGAAVASGRDEQGPES